MRAAIRRVPDGVYRYQMQTDGAAGGHSGPFTLRLALTIRDGELLADYTGTTQQLPCAINCPLTYTYAMTAYAVRCALLPDLPNNEGDVPPGARHCARAHAAEPGVPRRRGWPGGQRAITCRS